MAALTVGTLVLPYAGPFACGMADGPMQLRVEVRAEYPDHHDDLHRAGCEDVMDFGVQTPALDSQPTRDMLLSGVCFVVQPMGSHGLPTNLDPPLTPPPRA